VLTYSGRTGLPSGPLDRQLHGPHHGRSDDGRRTHGRGYGVRWSRECEHELHLHRVARLDSADHAGHTDYLDAKTVSPT